jgi:hypothetical protein
MKDQFVIAHTHTSEFRRDDRVNVYRTHRRASLRTALKKAAQIRGYGYLVWIELAEQMATR